MNYHKEMKTGNKLDDQMIRSTRKVKPNEVRVFTEYDGCINDPELFRGEEVECLEFIRNAKPLRGKWNYAMMDADGRMMSYVL